MCVIQVTFTRNISTPHARIHLNHLPINASAKLAKTMKATIQKLPNVTVPISPMIRSMAMLVTVTPSSNVIAAICVLVCSLS